MDILVEGLSLETPIYVVTEGYEPPFFTRFFEWDYGKANVSEFSELFLLFPLSLGEESNTFSFQENHLVRP